MAVSEKRTLYQADIDETSAKSYLHLIQPLILDLAKRVSLTSSEQLFYINFQCFNSLQWQTETQDAYNNIYPL